MRQLVLFPSGMKLTETFLLALRTEISAISTGKFEQEKWIDRKEVELPITALEFDVTLAHGQIRTVQDKFVRERVEAMLKAPLTAPKDVVVCPVDITRMPLILISPVSHTRFHLQEPSIGYWRVNTR